MQLFFYLLLLLSPFPTSAQTERQSCQASLLSSFSSSSFFPFALVSPDLSPSVSEPSLCLTDSLQVVSHSAASPQPAGTPPPRNTSRQTANEERPPVTTFQGEPREHHVLKLISASSNVVISTSFFKSIKSRFYQSGFKLCWKIFDKCKC